MTTTIRVYENLATGKVHAKLACARRGHTRLGAVRWIAMREARFNTAEKCQLCFPKESA